MPLKAVLLNCTLKKSPEPSHTQGLMDIVIGHLESLDVECETLRVVDATTNDVGQYPMYNKVGGVVVTGNEDGVHASAETTLFNLTHLGFTVPPNADTYWLGDAGPGPSFIDAGGAEHPYTRKTASWMAHNVLHMARILRDNPIPREGNPGPMAARAGMRENRARGQERRMIRALREEGKGQPPRRWWRTLRRH